MTRDLHRRAAFRTTEEAAAWLAAWSNDHLIPDGALPVRPWRRTPNRELIDIANALLKERARFDGDGPSVVTTMTGG